MTNAQATEMEKLAVDLAAKLTPKKTKLFIKEASRLSVFSFYNHGISESVSTDQISLFMYANFSHFLEKLSKFINARQPKTKAENLKELAMSYRCAAWGMNKPYWIALKNHATEIIGKGSKSEDWTAFIKQIFQALDQAFNAVQPKK